MTTGGKKNLRLVKPDNPLFVPPERTGLFHEGLTDTLPTGSFQSGLPEKAIEVPGPLVQQAIARAIAGLSESQAFQAMDTTQMAKVNRLAHGVPMDVVSEAQVDAQDLLEQDAKEISQSKKPYEKESEKKSEIKVPRTEADGDATGDEKKSTEIGAADAQLSEAPSAEHPLEAESSDAITQQESDRFEDTQDTGGSSGAKGIKETESAEQMAEASSASSPAEGDEFAAQEASGTEGMGQVSELVDPGGVLAPAKDEDVAEATHTNEKVGEHAHEEDDSDTTEDEPPAKDPRQEAIENFPVPEGMQLVSIDDLESIHQEAFESGRQAGLEEVAKQHDEAVTAARESAHQEGYDKGYEEAYTKGEAAARDELQAEVELAAQDLKDLTQKLEEAAKDTDQFYAPLLKLAMHLAEQLVRGELTVSGKAIAHLVETSLAEFENDPSSPILVKLNPEDLERIKTYETLLPKNVILKSDPTIFVGSVRVQINGAVIEDLIEQRSTALWQALTRGQDAGEPPPSFLKNLELMKEAFEEVDAEDETEQDRPLGSGDANVGQTATPEAMQADTAVASAAQIAEEPVSGELVPEESPSEERLGEGLTEEEADEAVAAVEEGSSATESPAMDQPIEPELAPETPTADQEPKP